MFRRKKLTEQQKIYKEFEGKRYAADFVPSELPDGFWFIICAGIFLIIFLVWTKKIMKFGDMIPYVVFICVVLFLLIKKTPSNTKILDEKIIKSILKGELMWKMKNSPSEIGGEECTVRILVNCRLQTVDGKPWMWRVGYKVFSQNGDRIYTAGLDPYKGYLIENYETPEGFDPEKWPHIKTVYKQDYNNQQQWGNVKQ